MLADIPAPFRSGAASPSLSSQVSIGPGGGGLASTPGSPLLLSTSLDSPGGYGLDLAGAPTGRDTIARPIYALCVRALQPLP